MKKEVRILTKNKPKIGLLIFTMLLPLLVGTLSALLTNDAMKQYFFMNKPPLSPPGWVFAPVWTLLYLLMGFASYQVITADGYEPLKRRASSLYIIQLILNFFWPVLFFACSMYLAAFIELMIMWVVIIICTVCFFKISRPAGFMMLPLALWTTFAAYLNLAAYILSITPMLLHK